jgi:caffeoyl-CoA O-methyltransferase
MMKGHITVDATCNAMLDAEAPVPDVARDLAWMSERLCGGIAVTLSQAAFLGWLAATLGARRILEVGTFTGLATLCLAEGAGPEGEVVTFEITEKWLPVARRHWEAAQVAQRITAHHGRVQDWVCPVEARPYDLIFLDGDKAEYVAYYEQLRPRLRAGGVLVADDTLWPHNTAHPSWASQMDGIEAFNAQVRADTGVTAVCLPMVNGMTLVRKH